MPKPIIICVDDETLVLDSLKIELKKFFNNSCLYEFASSGEEGLEIVADVDQEAPDSKKVVISDWWMPSMKGDEFLTAVHQKYPQITTIMLTGQASEAAIADVKEKANLYRCIRKPWLHDELMHTIKQVIQLN